MRKFWFAMSLMLVFCFAAASSYIFFVLTADSPGGEDEYRAVSDLSLGGSVARVSEDMTVLVREEYACGYVAERIESGGGEFLGLSFDQMTEDGWDVARVGEGRIEIKQSYDTTCPLEEECRLLKRTERGVAVYAGTAEHTGSLLMEMPLNFSELPPDINTALLGEGYPVNSPEELDELLESLDELIWAE